MEEYATKKDLEKFKNEIKNEIKDEFKQQTGIILEEFNRNLGFVIDQQQDMRRELNEKIESSAGGVRKELTQKIDSSVGGLRKELTQKIDLSAGDLRKELGQKIDSSVGGLRKELSQKIDLVHNEIIAHRDNTEIHVKQAKRPRRIK